MGTISNNALDLWKMIHFSQVANPTKCESCGLELPTHANAVNISMTAFVGVPGHPSLSSFTCPCSQNQQTEHWACSIECWEKMAKACIDNDMVPILKEGLERIHGNLSHDKNGLRQT